MPNPRKRCPTCHRLERRSNPQNARYWLLLHLIAEKLKPEGAEYSAESFHLYFKSRYIGCDDIRLPNGKIISIPKSSADLDVGEFAEYMTKIECFAQERGIYMEDIGETV